MNAGALFFSPNFHSLYKPKNPPDFSPGTKHPLFGHNSGSEVHNRFHGFRVSVWNSGRRRSGKVYADVREIPESIRKLVKFKDGLEDTVFSAEDLEGSIPWWEQFPKRWVIVVRCFSAFLLCNMDRVNMTIAVLSMSAEFNRSPTTVGLIQSSFFWGYPRTQIAGGIWADTVGGKSVLAFGVVWWFIATVLTPVAAKIGLPFLLLVRAFMGIGEGVAMPAMNNILSKWLPMVKRSRSLAVAYSGMYLGSVTGLAFSPFLIHKFGWPSVFFSFWFSRNSLVCCMAKQGT